MYRAIEGGWEIVDSSYLPSEIFIIEDPDSDLTTNDLQAIMFERSEHPVG